MPGSGPPATGPGMAGATTTRPSAPATLPSSSTATTSTRTGPEPQPGHRGAPPGHPDERTVSPFGGFPQQIGHKACAASERGVQWVTDTIVLMGRDSLCAATPRFALTSTNLPAAPPSSSPTRAVRAG